LVHDDASAAQLDVFVVLQQVSELLDVPRERLQQIVVADVACGHQEQLIWLAGKQEGLHEVCVLGDDCPLLLAGDALELRVGRLVPGRQLGRMACVLAPPPQRLGQASRQLRVDQERDHALL
jgi:hypothetical protein